MSAAEHEASTRAMLPVPYEPPVQPAPRRRRRRYEPRHALPGKRDAINVWLWLILLVTSGFVAGTTAVFSATIGESASSFGSTALTPPQNQTLTVAGNNLTMAVGSQGSATGGGTVGVRWRYYWPTGVSDRGTAPTCSNATSSYTNTAQDLGSSTSNSKTVTYPATVSGVSTNGRWMCVMSLTTYPAIDPTAPAQQWLSQNSNPFGEVQLGHVVKSVSFQNVSSVGNLTTSDKIVITFNQAVDGTGLPASGAGVLVCARADDDKILIGYTGANCTAAAVDNDNAPYTLVGLYAGFNVPNAALAATGVWSAGNTVWTGTITSGTSSISGSCTAALDTTGGGCFEARTQYTVNPGTALESATGAKALCTADPVGTPDAGVCWPRTTNRP